jgi:histidyl-tRNA synthetase
MTQLQQIVTPKPISGFPEWLPEEKILENWMLDIIRRHYESAGFSPIETSVVERVEVLTAKGGNEKEIYALRRLLAEPGDDTGDLALHFDLTVPLARYVAQHYREVAFPFRRYQMQKVWRGERPQSGRFREFYQCDIDVIGDGQLSFMTDAEIPSIIYRIFREMNIGPFVIRINNRKVLQGYFAGIGVPQDMNTQVLRIVDKLEKIGIDQVIGELTAQCGLSEGQARQVVDFTGTTLTNDTAIGVLKGVDVVNEIFSRGVDELEMVLNGIRAFGVPDEYFCIDLKIARGLDYYTGTVYETVLVDHPSVGSICSGGRYDDLAGYFIDRKLPGVGISIGATRLLSRLLKAGILKSGASTVAPVLVTSMDETRMLDYLQMASTLRAAGIGTEVYLEPKKLGVQLKYADKKGFRVVVIAGETEFSKGTVIVKDLVSGKQEGVPFETIVETVKKRI